MSLIAIQPDQLPTPADESWKYTDLPKAMRKLPANLKRADIEEENILVFKKGEEQKQPKEITFIGLDNHEHINQLKIVLEAGAQVTIIERHVGVGAYWKNRVTDIEIGKGAVLNHIRIQNDSQAAVNTNISHIKTARDAVYKGFSLNIGAALSRHEIHADIEGENAEVTFNGVNLLNANQHGDTTIVINHKAPHCASNQFYRTLLDDNARGVFQGKICVAQVAQKTDGYQLANTLLLSPNAEMDTKPELEIYADDVKCSHGTTTGQLDEAPLFYLRQRGLSESQARTLLIQSFVGEVIDKISHEQIRDEIQALTDSWLHKALQK